MVLRLFFLLLGFLVLFSCGSETNNKMIDRQTEESLSVDELLDRTPSTLSVSDYIALLKKMKGVTYDEVETPQVYISLIYKPRPLEAALSLTPEELKSSFKEALKQKEGYHYLLINYLDKNPSITGNRASKQEVLTMLREKLVVVKNETDTLQAITEVIPSSIAGQPDQIIVLIPESSKDLRLKVVIPGKYFECRDVAIDLPMSMLQQLPELTL